MVNKCSHSYPFVHVKSKKHLGCLFLLIMCFFFNIYCIFDLPTAIANAGPIAPVECCFAYYSKIPLIDQIETYVLTDTICPKKGVV